MCFVITVQPNVFRVSVLNQSNDKEEARIEL
jgi:hypothetical protein